MKPTSPNPTWKSGDPISSPHHKSKLFDAKTLTPAEIYKLIVNVVVPRPIAFVTTISPSGHINLAPFSFFNAISSNPPTLMIAVTRKSDGSKKDTLINIEQQGEFVVNMANRWLIEPLVQTSAEYPYGVSELAAVGLSELKSTHVTPPRVRESAVNIECVRHQIVEIGDGSVGSSCLIIGKIVALHIAENALQDGRIDYHELAPVARLGGTDYAEMGQIYSILRPKSAL